MGRQHARQWREGHSCRPWKNTPMTGMNSVGGRERQFHQGLDPKQDLPDQGSVSWEEAKTRPGCPQPGAAGLGAHFQTLPSPDFRGQASGQQLLCLSSHAQTLCCRPQITPACHPASPAPATIPPLVLSLLSGYLNTPCTHLPSQALPLMYQTS